MKKLSAMLICAIGMMSLASCKKDRTCSCTTGSHVSTITYNKATKRQAKNNCLSYTLDNTKTECEIKK